MGVNVGGADLSGANLRSGTFYDANLTVTNLKDSDLGGAEFIGANLAFALLHETKLDRANLQYTNFSGASLVGADLTNAVAGGTPFDELNLGYVQGLESVKHNSPSTIGIDTIFKSHGNIPEVFLRGCGVPDEMVAFVRSIRDHPVEFYCCFISYSSKDEDIAKRLHADLQARGVRVWFAPADLKIGDKVSARIDEAIRVYDKLLLILSENSIHSARVRREVKTAHKKEDTSNRTVLFPIRLDDTAMDTTEQWADDLRRERHIGDFRQWKEHDCYRAAFARLIRDLQADFKPPNPHLQ